MLGFGDFWVAAAFWANPAIVLICLIYGIIYWNRDNDNPENDRK